MTRQDDYYGLVDALFKYRNHKTLQQLLYETMEELRQKGYDPTFCALFLEKTLRDEAARLRTFGE